MALDIIHPSKNPGIVGSPVGSLVWMPKDAAAPAGHIRADGNAFNAATFPALAAYLGSNVTPNVANRVLRMAGTDTGAAGTTQEDMIKAHNHTSGFSVNSSHVSGARYGVTTGLANSGLSDSDLQVNVDVGTNGLNTSPTGGAETRVKSFIGVCYIKAYSDFVGGDVANLVAMEQSVTNLTAALAAAKAENVWKPVYRLRSGTFTELIIPNLAGYDKLRASYQVRMTGGHNSLGMQCSKDNGQTFHANYRRSATDQDGSTVAANRYGEEWAVQFNMVDGMSTSASAHVRWEWENFGNQNLGDYSYLLGEMHYYAVAGVFRKTSIASMVQGVESWNALRFKTPNNTGFAVADMLIEGYKSPSS